MIVIVAAALGVVQFHETPRDLARRPFARVEHVAAGTVVSTVPVATPSANAFGKSGEVKVRFALPGEAVEYPLEVRGDPSSLSYAWVRLGDTVPSGVARPLAGSDVIAPPAPGFYQLAVGRDGERQVVSEITVAVLVPFAQKVGATLNGYRIGTYVAERLGEQSERPDGFIEVAEQNIDLPLTTHLRLADFITRDGQSVWPRYTALSPRLLDKLELVIAEIARVRGDSARVHVAVDVHSGFRTPAYNRGVPRAARDSRHQYGDAADVAIDANGDGRYTALDARLTARAVERIEREHPELTGGLGIYTSRRQATPYVHIDARGHRARWRG